MDAIVVYIDQTKTLVNGDPTQAWFKRNPRPSAELSGLRDWTGLPGAIPEDGESLFFRFPEYITAEHAKHIIFALYKEFEEELIIAVLISGVGCLGLDGP